jgi:hypothetical protein
MKNFYDAITDARKLMADVPATKVSETTARRYREQMQRICGLATGTADIIGISADTAKVNTW